jgi:hypothetical protein
MQRKTRKYKDINQHYIRKQHSHLAHEQNNETSPFGSCTSAKITGKIYFWNIEGNGPQRCVRASKQHIHDHSTYFKNILSNAFKLQNNLSVFI